MMNKIPASVLMWLTSITELTAIDGVVDNTLIVVDRAVDENSLFKKIERLPALMLVSNHVSAAAAERAILKIRSTKGATADIPVISLGCPPPGRTLFDGFIDPNVPADVLVGALKPWIADPNPVLGQLIDVFGREEIEKLVLSLRATLNEVLAIMPDPAKAHQIAGLAGTLGYAMLGNELNKVASGNISHVDIYRLIRLAMYHISQNFIKPRLIKVYTSRTNGDNRLEDSNAIIKRND